MKTIFMTMAALSAIAVAAPASAQRWDDRGTDSRELRMQIDAGVRTGAISRREMMPLRDDLRRLITLERQFGNNGISGREHAILQQRGNTLRRQINMAERTGNRRFDRDRRAEWEDSDDRYDRDRRAGWDDRDDRDDRYGSNERFDRPDRGDRFHGDVRVGQLRSARMVDLPERYRDEYRDSDEVYYRYDDNRIYQVDRVTGIILRLFDLPI